MCLDHTTFLIDDAGHDDATFLLVRLAGGILVMLTDEFVDAVLVSLEARLHIRLAFLLRSLLHEGIVAKAEIEELCSGTLRHTCGKGE